MLNEGKRAKGRPTKLRSEQVLVNVIGQGTKVPSLVSQSSIGSKELWFPHRPVPKEKKPTPPLVMDTGS